MIDTQEKRIKQRIDQVEFDLKEATDFSFLKEYGQVFCVFDQNDSGNISFGVQNQTGEKFFIKVAGAKTIEGNEALQTNIQRLQETLKVYQDLKYPSVIECLSSGSTANLFYVVFKWHEGECLYDHWNFDFYHKNPDVKTPRHRIFELPTTAKLRLAEMILDFITFVEHQNYVAVDFYDGSLMYDFERQQLTICDIDLFKKTPSKNEEGIDYWGTKRMKAPEEYQLGATIDSQTNVFTVGALFLNLFGEYPREILEQIYQENCFIPMPIDKWSLSKANYLVLLKAVQPKRSQRFSSVAKLREAWRASLK